MPIPEWVKQWIDTLDHEIEEIVEINPQDSTLVEHTTLMPGDPLLNWWTEPLTPLDASEEYNDR